MYPEFIAIYVGLAVLAALLAVVLILQIKLLKRSDTRSAVTHFDAKPSQTILRAPEERSAVLNPSISSGNVVFCRHCAAEFDASQRICPRCGTPR